MTKENGTLVLFRSSQECCVFTQMSVSEFTTAIRRAAAGIWAVPDQLEPRSALCWQRAASLIAHWRPWKKNKESWAQHMFNTRASQGDRRRHSPHDCWEQQSRVLFTNTSPSLLQAMGSGIGQMMGWHSTLNVSLSQTQFLQLTVQDSPICTRG